MIDLTQLDDDAFRSHAEQAVNDPDEAERVAHEMVRRGWVSAGDVALGMAMRDVEEIEVPDIDLNDPAQVREWMRQQTEGLR